VINVITENNLLHHFEQQLDALIRYYKRLKENNVALRDKQEILMNEVNACQQKLTRVTERIDDLIRKLKTLEEAHGRN
jgi:uncharacterized protein (TIGR02449 family)